ncbi:hypothetical protein [Pandoraea terrigena]|uniref:hypothetical protein n=1 Tax=Pandoraea terrigena TaxID=2508292 RepID=UPI00123EE71C|nr:hypothetical protein [Pandoraea terrigena]
MRDRFVVLDFDAITDDSATYLVTRRDAPPKGSHRLEYARTASRHRIGLIADGSHCRRISLPAV